jgi:hypothetical protein
VVLDVQRQGTSEGEFAQCGSAHRDCHGASLPVANTYSRSNAFQACQRAPRESPNATIPQQETGLESRGSMASAIKAIWCRASSRATRRFKSGMAKSKLRRAAMSST